MEDRAVRDQQVVRAVLAGDRDGFGALVEQYQRLVASVAWRYGTRQDEIEDLVSEVFLKVYRNLARILLDPGHLEEFMAAREPSEVLRVLEQVN